MSIRKRMSLGGLWRKENSSYHAEGAEDGEGGKDNRRRSRRPSLSPFKKFNWATGIVQRSLTAAAVVAKDLFTDLDGDSYIEDHYGELYVKRGLNQRADFEARYRHLVETLGNLNRAADVDPDTAAGLLQHSGVREDLETMLTLLMMEERQNRRFERFRIETGDSGPEGGGGADRVASPCLEFLLEERVVKLLCEMGAADRPPGIMSLALGAMAVLLGEVGHPLLPSQTVHDPIAKLVAAAGVRDGQEDGGGVKGVQSRAGGGGVKKAPEGKVKSNLARLLGAIWRKLLEESALLDFFFRVESKAETQKLADSTGSVVLAAAGLRRLDLFDGLLPLLDLPGKAGLYAREACLVALSVKDVRVGQFAAGSTHLCEQLSRTLTARYLELYDALEELHAAAAATSTSTSSLPELQGEEWDEETVDLAAPMAFVMQRRLDEADEAFGDALSLFLQHLRFCNAVGLVAFDTEACLRPQQKDIEGISGKGSNGGIPVSAVPAKEGNMFFQGGDGVAASLAMQTRQSFLGEALGPALASALESRAGFAQAIAMRTVTELSAGVEEYGIAVDGIAAGVEEGVRCRRQLGPLLDTIAASLVGREGPFGSWGVPGGDLRRSAHPDVKGMSAAAAAAPEAETKSAMTGWGEGASVPGSMIVINSKSGASLRLRDVLLRRIESSSVSLRLSTLELIESLAELRDDRVLLDLALRPLEPTGESVRGAVDNVHTAEGPSKTHVNGEGCEAHLQGEKESTREQVEALLDGSPGGALERLRVSSGMVDSFANAFVGSSIHPNVRRHVASGEGLERYVIEAHQRQIQQLMEAAKGCRLDARDATVMTPEEFDAEAFAREHGAVIASAADAEGSFIHALFDGLEAVFERTLEENVAVTGVLSSLCLAATATEVSPVRRLLLVLLFDGTKDAQFRSMRRILESLWESARSRVSSLPNASRRLARARSLLGIVDGDNKVTEDRPAVGIGGGQGSRGMREELKMARRASIGSEDPKEGAKAPATALELQQREQESKFLETYVFLEEFLKELFCAMSAKCHVESDASGLSESHRAACLALRVSLNGGGVDESERIADAASVGRRQSSFGSEGKPFMENGVDVTDLPTSMDEFLRQATFPAFLASAVV